MDKFTTLYNQYVKKLGKLPPSNQYAGMSVKFILEDIDKTAKLLCEDTGNEGLMKGLFKKLCDGVQTAISTSLKAFIEFAEGLKNNSFLEKLFQVETCFPKIDISRYCTKESRACDPDQEGADIEKDDAAFSNYCMHLYCNIDGIVKAYNPATDPGRYDFKRRTVASEGVITGLLSAGLSGFMLALKWFVFMVFALLSVVAWIAEMVAKGVVVTSKWISFLSGLGALYTIGRGDLHDDFKEKFDWLHGKKQDEASEDDDEEVKAQSVEVHFLTDGGEEKVEAKDGKTLATGILDVIKEKMAAVMNRFSPDK